MKIMIAEDDFRVADIHEQFLQQIDQVKVVAKARDAKETYCLLVSITQIYFCSTCICLTSLESIC